jgi:hypothetical protein
LSANLLWNSISVEQAQELVKIMRAKENLTTLCGLSREETELDFSGQHLPVFRVFSALSSQKQHGRHLGAGDAVLIANNIRDMTALSSLTFSGEPYDKDGQFVHDAVTITAAMTDADFSGKHLGSPGAIILAAWLSSDKGGLSSLDLTDNMLGERDMTTISCVLKEHAIQHQRACACLVGYEFMTKDLRALLVATYNLDPRCWLLAIRIEQLCKDIASWL